MANTADKPELTPHEIAEQSLSEIGGGSQYSNDQRREAATLYVLLGNQARVSDQTGIPENTLQEWRTKSGWWDDVTTEVRSQKDDEIKANFDQLVREGQRVALEKINECSAKDAVVIAGISADKRRTMDGLSNNIKGDQITGGILNALEALSDKLDAGNEKRVVSDQ